MIPLLKMNIYMNYYQHKEVNDVIDKYLTKEYDIDIPKDVYTKDEVLSMLNDLRNRIIQTSGESACDVSTKSEMESYNKAVFEHASIIQEKIHDLESKSKSDNNRDNT